MRTNWKTTVAPRTTRSARAARGSRAAPPRGSGTRARGSACRPAPEPGVRPPREHEGEREGEPPRQRDLEDQELQDVVVAADREHETDRDEDERPRGADHPLHEDGARDLRLRVGPAARVLDDAHGVAADCRRQHLPGRVADEVELRQPGERLVDPLRGQERLPAPGHPHGRHQEDHVRGEQVPAVARPDQVDRLPEVDLPDQVGEDARADEHLQSDANRPADPHGIRW